MQASGIIRKTVLFPGLILMSGCMDIAIDTGSPPGERRSEPLDITNFAMPSFMPHSGPTRGGIPVEIDGTGFEPGVAVRFGNNLATQVTVLSSNRIIAMLPKSDNAWSSVPIVLTSPNGLTVSSNDLFNYYASSSVFEENFNFQMPNPKMIIAADFNNDTFPDLYAISATESRLALNNYSKFFTNAQVGASGASVIAVAAGDFDTDGNIDLALVDRQFDQVNIALLTGTGSIDLYNASKFTVCSGPQSITAADLDGNGILDLVIPCKSGITIMLGTGRGQFGIINVSGRGDLNRIGIGDFNNDKKTDLISCASGELTLFQGDGTGFSFIQRVVSPCLTSFAIVTVGDFNGDRNLDVVVSKVVLPESQVFWGDGKGNFSLVTSISGWALGSAPTDFNGDGKLDLLSGGGLHLGDGAGSFAATPIPIGSPGLNLFSVGDLNGDRKPDVVTLHPAGVIQVFINKSQ